ncbi:MAG: hypothetical protein AAF311_15120 [Pseudomonadota bacterium]
MTLETIYYITQIIAVGLILASLIAIYIEQRKDHALARAEHQRELLANFKTLPEYLAEDRENLEAITACLQDFDGATPYQKAKFTYAAHLSVNSAEQALYMRNDKLISKAIFLGMLGIALQYLTTPGGRQWWNRVRLSYGADSRDLLDKELAEQTSVSSIWEAWPMFEPAPSTPTPTDDPEADETSAA